MNQPHLAADLHRQGIETLDGSVDGGLGGLMDHTVRLAQPIDMRWIEPCIAAPGKLCAVGPDSESGAGNSVVSLAA